MGWATFWSIFFTSSSGHPDAPDGRVGCGKPNFSKSFPRKYFRRPTRTFIRSYMLSIHINEGTGRTSFLKRESEKKRFSRRNCSSSSSPSFSSSFWQEDS
jgi:hypothetical protein